MTCLAVGVAAGLGLTAGPVMPAIGSTETVSAGSLRATVESDPWGIYLHDQDGRSVLSEAAGSTSGPAGPLGFETVLGTWVHATRALELGREGEDVVATVETSDPAGATIDVRVSPAGEGSIRIQASVASPLGATATGIGFEADPSERYLGFGERSNAVDQRGLVVENYVADGPYRPEDREYPKPVTPPWAISDRDDSTYYPVPWMLSTRGYGVLIENDETSYFRLGSDVADVWSLEAQSARLSVRVFAGPSPADALRRFSEATGRQPPPATPWSFGPWFQTGQPNKIPLENEREWTTLLREADAPVSAAETQMHFLPCGAHRGEEDYNRQRTDYFHSQGLAHLVYFNPLLCVSYQPVDGDAAAAGVLQRQPLTGLPYTYPGFVGGGGPAGFTAEPLSQFDFTAPGARDFYGGLVREAFDAGHDGWMEDFGEYTPPDAVSADGTSPQQIHNRYPTDYHCAVFDIVRELERPVSRHQRSGWTGAARCADVVWGGDPTTVFGYDGLESAVRQALSIGLSGVSRWGSDIGGYHSFGPAEQLDVELLHRWIEFGAVSGVMRTKASGLAVPSYDRPQIWEPESIGVWRLYAKLHTQLYPYILAADRTYRETGLPLMRHLALVAPDDPAAIAQEDEFMFGPDLLAAPVVERGARERRLYAPAGRWIDFWRSVGFEESSGAFVLGRVESLSGGQDHVLPAPLDQLPLLVRVGAVIPMLAPDVDTLADYGHAPGLVHLSDRRDRMRLLAFPRGRSAAGFNESERLVSRERRRRWSLRVQGAIRRQYRLQASMATLKRPFRPCTVKIKGRRLGARSWSYDRKSRVLTARFKTRRGRLVVRGCPRRH